MTVCSLSVGMVYWTIHPWLPWNNIPDLHYWGLYWPQSNVGFHVKNPIDQIVVLLMESKSHNNQHSISSSDGDYSNGANEQFWVWKSTTLGTVLFLWGSIFCHFVYYPINLLLSLGPTGRPNRRCRWVQRGQSCPQKCGVLLHPKKTVCKKQGGGTVFTL